MIYKDPIVIDKRLQQASFCSALQDYNRALLMGTGTWVRPYSP
jgi:hypothetical protein